MSESPINPLPGRWSLPGYVLGGHLFFVRNSLRYSGKTFVRHPLQWLRAYVRFMWFTVRDWWAFRRIRKQLERR